MMTAKDAATALWEAFRSREPDRIRAALTDDAKWFAPPQNATQMMLGLPADHLESREGIVDFICNHFRRAFPNGANFEFTKMVSDEDTVMMEQRMTAVTFSGKPYDNLYCWVMLVQAGKVREIREYMDTYAGHRMIFGDETPREVAPR